MARKPEDPTVLVCGEALVDVFVDAVGPKAFPARIVPGGSPLNVAIGLARLGVRSGFFSGLAKDSFGAHLHQVLHNEGVDERCIVYKSGLTTMSVVATDAKGSPSYTFYGDQGADRQLTVEDVPASLGDKTKAITFGSYSMAVEPAGSAYLALAEREGKKRFISLDPNIRTKVTPVMSMARKAFERFIPHCTMIKASEEDIHLVFGAVPIEDVASEWLQAGAAMVIVTHGPKGATAFRGEDIIDLAGISVKVRDTVGAGDTFHAAIIAYLERHNLLSRDGVANMSSAYVGEMLNYAITASALTCTRQGADMPTLAEVDSALKEGIA